MRNQKTVEILEALRTTFTHADPGNDPQTGKPYGTQQMHDALDAAIEALEHHPYRRVLYQLSLGSKGPTDWSCADCSLENTHPSHVTSVGAVSAALYDLQRDPHQWSTRYCGTCWNLSAWLGQPFGCTLYRKDKQNLSQSEHA